MNTHVHTHVDPCARSQIILFSGACRAPSPRSPSPTPWGRGPGRRAAHASAWMRWRTHTGGMRTWCARAKHARCCARCCCRRLRATGTRGSPLAAEGEVRRGAHLLENSGEKGEHLHSRRRRIRHVRSATRVQASPRRRTLRHCPHAAQDSAGRPERHHRQRRRNRRQASVRSMLHTTACLGAGGARQSARAAERTRRAPNRDAITYSGGTKPPYP